MKINTVVANFGEWTVKVHTQNSLYNRTSQYNKKQFFTCCSMTNWRGERIRLRTKYSSSEKEASEVHLSLCEKAKNFFGETS